MGPKEFMYLGIVGLIGLVLGGGLTWLTKFFKGKNNTTPKA